MLPNRHGGSDSYRFGFQGQEKDDEIKGEGNSLNYKYRMHDPRVGRFFAVDPSAREFAWNSSFAYSENRVIDRIELEGMESWDYLEPTPHQKEDTKVQTATKIASNVGKNILNMIPYAFNIVEVFGRGGPSKVINYLEKDLDNLSYGIASDMIKAKQEEGISEFGQYAIDRIQKPEVIEAAATIIVTEKISKSIVGNTPKPIIRQKLATEFYRKAGYIGEKRVNHLSGINFEMPVQTVTLKKGTIVQQWVGENGVGSYFTNLENGSTQNLGISYSNRVLKQFELTSDVKVLKSTAADLGGNKGGGLQYFSPEIKNIIMPIE